MKATRIPTDCPSCSAPLHVKRLECPNCGTGVDGDFELPTLARLPPEEQQLALEFLKSSGNLKELAKLHGVSYPTVRNRVDSLIERIRTMEDESERNKEK